MGRLLRCMVVLALAATTMPGPTPAAATTMTIREVLDAVRPKPASTLGQSFKPNLAGADLGGLDLSGIDFHHADLTGANLFGADLTGANLSGADLTDAVLNRAIIARADFTGAVLVRASLMLVSSFTTVEPSREDAPDFTGADLSGARLLADFSWCKMRGAKLIGVVASPGRDRVAYVHHTYLTGCDMTGADLTGADLSESRLPKVILTGANLTQARFGRSDLTEADLSGALLRDTDFTLARLTGVKLASVR